MTFARVVEDGKKLLEFASL